MNMDEREGLRKHQGRGAALNQAPCNQPARGRRQPAERRGQRKTRHPEDESNLPPKNIPEPASGNETDRIGQSIAGNNQLDLAIRRAQGMTNRGNTDISYKEVDNTQEGPDENDGQRQPLIDASPFAKSAGARPKNGQGIRFQPVKRKRGSPGFGSNRAGRGRKFHRYKIR